MPHLFIPLDQQPHGEFFQELASYVEHEGDHFRYNYLLLGMRFAAIQGSQSDHLIQKGIRLSYDPEEVANLCKELNAQKQRGNSPCLYLYNHRASRRKLIIAEAIEILHTEGEIPPPDKWVSDMWGPGPQVYGTRWCHSIIGSSGGQNLVYSNLWFRIETLVPIVDRNIPAEMSNLVYANDSVAPAGSHFTLSNSIKCPVLVEQKDFRDYFDRIDIEEFISPRDESLPLSLHYKKGHEGTKYGAPVDNFLRRLWSKVPFITSIRVYAEQRDQQADSYSAEVGRIDVIKGRKAFKSGKKNHTLLFRVFTTCTTEQQQERLLRHLRWNF